MKNLLLIEFHGASDSPYMCSFYAVVFGPTIRNAPRFVFEHKKTLFEQQQKSPEKTPGDPTQDLLRTRLASLPTALSKLN